MPDVAYVSLLHATEHVPPTVHPENAERFAPFVEELAACRPGYLCDLPLREHDRAALTRVHYRQYLEGVESLAESGGCWLDADTYLSAGSYRAAVRVSNALMSAVDAAFGEGPRRAFVVGRPPGHHAESDRAMGFCIINHVAVAAQYALDSKYCRQAAIVDFDIHHGNGTQEIFYSRADVLYVSSHQYPYYPGTGAAAEMGTGDGAGYTLNLPFGPGCDDQQLLHAYQTTVAERIRRFAPGLILVSAGFDGHTEDPLGGFHLTADAFGRLGELLAALAAELCDGRLVAFSEGGYNPSANREAMRAFLEGMAV